MANIIHSAKSRVIYAAPALDEVVANALINTANKIGFDSVSVLLDISENVFRCGYGNIEGVTLLNNNNVTIKEVAGIRIGVLIYDNEGVVFSQPPLLIEAGREDEAQPNGIQVTSEQANEIVNAIIPKLDIENNKKPTPEIGKTDVSLGKIQNIQKVLTDNPAQKFDIARKVQVFSTAIEFVELKLTGCEIQRHTVKIPTELLVGNVDLATKKQLKAGFNIIEKNSSISGDSIRDEVNKIRTNYFQPIPKYGNTLLKSSKDKFNKDLAALQESIKSFQKEVKANLETEIATAQTNLVEMLAPAIKANPPKDLLGGIQTNTPTEAQVKKYIELKLKNIFPSADSMTKAMSVDCIFKAVTYEAIFLDNDFQKQISDAYPLIEWDKMLEEYNAAPDCNK